MASSYQDLIDSLFNPYASEIMQAYGYTPSTGTPSITDPGTYNDPGGPSPGVYVPPTGTPGPVINPYDGTGDPPIVTDPAEPADPTDPTGPSDPTNPTGPSDPTGPSGPSGPGMWDGTAAGARGHDNYLHSKRALMWGDQLDPRKTMSLDDFIENVLPYAEGKYGSGMTYDPKTGLVYNNITQEQVAERRKNVDRAGNAYAAAGFWNVHPSITTDLEKRIVQAGGHGEIKPGTKYLRLGGPYEGTHYFIEGDQVFAYNYSGGDTLGFGGMGPKYSDNKSDTKIEFEQWVDDLKPESAEAPADAEAEKKEEVGPTLASEMLIEQSQAPAPEITTPDETGGRSTTPDAFDLTPQEKIAPALTPTTAQGGLLGGMPASDILGRIGGLPNLGNLQNLQLPETAPPTPPGITPGMMPSLPTPSAPAMPPVGATAPEPAPPAMPDLSGLPSPMAGMGMGMGAPAPAPSAPEPPVPTPPTPEPTAPALPSLGRTPEETAAIQRAVEELRRTGMRFNQGGPVTTGIGGLFRREVMR